jgi:hypothetical protein
VLLLFFEIEFPLLLIEVEARGFGVGGKFTDRGEGDRDERSKREESSKGVTGNNCCKLPYEKVDLLDSISLFSEKTTFIDDFLSSDGEEAPLASCNGISEIEDNR